MPAGRERPVKILRVLLTMLAALAASPASAQATHIAATLVPERATAPAGETILLAVSMKPMRPRRSRSAMSVVRAASTSRIALSGEIASIVTPMARTI